MTNTISHARLLEVLAYDPETGIFTWKKRGRRGLARTAGSVAGTKHCGGYRMIKVDDEAYQAHRLAWFYVTGRWPNRLDHIDTVKTHNAFANLREATRAQNSYNVGRRKNNMSGFKGVYWDKGTRKWRAAIRANGKRIHLGRFATPEEAHEAYKAAAPIYHGEFARAA